MDLKEKLADKGLEVVGWIIAALVVLAVFGGTVMDLIGLL